MPTPAVLAMVISYGDLKSTENLMDTAVSVFNITVVKFDGQCG